MCVPFTQTKWKLFLWLVDCYSDKYSYIIGQKACDYLLFGGPILDVFYWLQITLCIRILPEEGKKFFKTFLEFENGRIITVQSHYLSTNKKSCTGYVICAIEQFFFASLTNMQHFCSAEYISLMFITWWTEEIVFFLMDYRKFVSFLINIKNH